MLDLSSKTDSFIESHQPFVEYICRWKENLSPIKMKDIITGAGGPEHVAVISIDMIEGFCRVGPLSSERIKSIIDPVVEVLKKADSMGGNNIILSQDAHEENSAEFGAFPPHCIAGSQEAETVREFKELPFFDTMKVIPKKSLSPEIEAGLGEWLLSKKLKKIITIGDCTDLCTYQLAMFLRMLANARGLDWEVILPANCVETYDLPLEVAKKIGANPHPGDFFHLIFLYHMKLNGINVVKEII